MSKKYLIIILSVGIILILVLSVLLFGGNKTVAITFDSTGGSAVESFELKIGETTELPPDPIKEGHTFLGWHTGPKDEAELFLEHTVVKDDITLYAKWSINRYTITYDVGYHASVMPETYDFDAAIDEPNKPEREGLVFGGWYEGEARNEAFAFERMPARDVRLEARWLVPISFEANGGNEVDIEYVPFEEHLSLPEVSKEGHTLEGWYVSFTEGVTYDEKWSFERSKAVSALTLYAKWTINDYQLSFETYDGSTIDPVQLTYGSSLDAFVPVHAGGYYFDGWYLENTFSTRVESLPAMDATLYAKWVFGVPMVSVGEADMSYTFPIGTEDQGTAELNGGYLIAATETTYGLWYAVYTWAEENGYVFKNPGRIGSHGAYGEEPDEQESLEPVGSVAWADVIVWLNAYSEMMELDPVYRAEDGTILRNSSDDQKDLWDAAVQTDHNGYRLPTSREWEMAARWRNEAGEGSIPLGGRHWTPGSYASGAYGLYDDHDASDEVAWYQFSDDHGVISTTHPVGMKKANDLGLYDMSGNIMEWVFEWHPDEIGGKRIVRGGCFGSFDSAHLRVGLETMGYTYHAYDFYGFRMARSVPVVVDE
jgi:uncharacterized repeat protein (TIGR02543 family)